MSVNMTRLPPDVTPDRQIGVMSPPVGHGALSPGSLACQLTRGTLAAHGTFVRFLL